ncbi:MAG: hypothetical protein Q7L55_02390 [Actinomycetota bacterium]|nr:hypothetical protein [Actinomycetota bacterium]
MNTFALKRRGQRTASLALPLIFGLTALVACAAPPLPTAITSTPSAGQSVPGIPQSTNDRGNSTAITSLTVPASAKCVRDDGTQTWIDVAWKIKGTVTGVTWTRDGTELGDGYDAQGALSLPFTCDGKSHTFGLVAQGVDWPSDYQVANAIVLP